MDTKKKQNAAKAAEVYVKAGMAIGLGAESAAYCLIQEA